ncbi:hypothetical protein [Corynebacterium glyciniphilum]|uniref:hypothetical protein n=1 Tax=Corynebacterium glyciniphilum TaxID=1404244 RepID=UPI003FD2D89A
MAGFGVNVYGAQRLTRTLKKADLDVKRLTRINRQAASTVAAAARLRAPLGVKTSKSRKRYRPGKLRASIRAGATTRAGVIRAGGTRVKYAQAIHWGWPKRNIQPDYYISDAAIATEPVWIKDYESHMNKVVKSVKGVK